MYVVIMAGGSGTRFWPLSRTRHPKQLLRITGAVSMIRSTFERLQPLVPPAQVVVVTRAEQAQGIRDELPELPEANLLVEPEGRNTAPCIGLAAAVLQAQGAVDDTMVVLPADHAIRQEEAFRDVLQAGDRFLAEHDVLLTLGIEPHRPETGYGYIRLSEETLPREGWNFRRVERFVEKPDLETARQLVADGRHLWNSGMFLWRVSRIRTELERHVPGMGPVLEGLRRAHGTAGWERELEVSYPRLPKLSIDYGVMEKAESVWVVPVDLGWSDVGSWASLAELREKDDAGNVLPDVALAVEAHDNLVEGRGRAVVLLGVSDLVIVDAEDALLVCHRDRAQDVGKIPERLRGRGQDSLT